MLPEPRIGVLIDRRAVEAPEAPVVAREVRRHPIDDHADVAPMERIDETTEPVGVPEAGRRGVIASDLIPPRSAERMLGNREQLDVCEAERTDMLPDTFGQIVPGARIVTP